MHAIAVARCVIAVRGETAAIAVGDDAFEMQAAVFGDQSTAQPAQMEDRCRLRCGRTQHAQIVDFDGVGVQRQRRRDRGQRFRPARQLERLIALGQQQRRAGHLHGFETQTTAEQRLQHRIEHDALRGEDGQQRGLAAGPRDRLAVAVRTGAMHVAQIVQRHRPRGRTFGTRPSQLVAFRQTLDDLVQQHIAPAQGVEQEVQQQRREHAHDEDRQQTARRQPARARAPTRAQLGDARLAFFLRGCGFAHARTHPRMHAEKCAVIPANAGTQRLSRTSAKTLGSRVRGNDVRSSDSHSHGFTDPRRD
jgi:hypothetical protein